MAKNEAETESDQVVYGFAIPRDERDDLNEHCVQKFGMKASDYMRLVVRAILDDRLSIERPNDKVGVYRD